MYKNNSRYSSKIEGFSQLQFLCGLTSLKPEIGHNSYTKRCASYREKEDSNEKT